MAPPPPNLDFLAAQIRWVCGRGVPLQEAEDIVFDAYHRAARTFSAERGSFESYMHAIVRNACAGWWRRDAQTARAQAHLRVLDGGADSALEEQASRNQSAMLDALDEGERKIFAAWALQKHLGKGQVTSVEVSRSLGMGVSEYENAKRRLRSRLHRLLHQFGWSVSQLLYGTEHADRAG